MLKYNLDALNLLATPVWVVSPDTETLLFSNTQAQKLAAGRSLNAMRSGRFSAVAQKSLSMYLPCLQNQEDVVEIWSICPFGEESTISCRAVLCKLETVGEVLIFEGISGSTTAAALKASRSSIYRSRKQGFYARFFYTTSAPMLLIDPARDGLIVDANLAALRFYGYDHKKMCQKHTWEINTMGRNVLPVMSEIANLPGGHKPLNFIHRLADGSTRHVQTYSGPVEIYGKRLMLCIVHDINEQKRLEQELEYAAHRDTLTGLLNRRQFYHLAEYVLPTVIDFCVMLVDADHFKHINDHFGHQCGDEVLVELAHTLEANSHSGDYVFRWGGEEFLLLLPDTRLDAALDEAEAIRMAIANIAMPGLPGVTVSIGVAHHLPNESLDTLFRRVDEALYRAKNNGRNRVQAA
ncbi:sensor domain-containing diguanylate cyclase [Kosakonia oryziphila]|jgi:PAS domain S-box/diguanylate cyclase (GGDEF) domain|uniref:diguanylate cyclase n=1 Tax=Kosakonia oryziphila TaxID=1005667 RepID=A0A1C4BDP7_9ENTR|nr:sensor domain-containing diguanylate cyclase [Kosakonia oryziphila]SCC05071.1 PAS domain S-box-containing protein/diguanylate cyclase (GGDEF) domain-containing protein [Kosakonia oryziphila]